MAKAHPKIERERKTLEAMIRIFCRESHGTKGEICNDCAGLLAYAVTRLDKCPFGAKKPTCANCPALLQARHAEQIRASCAMPAPDDLEAPGPCRLSPHRGPTKAPASSSPEAGPQKP
jgi:hypothetical protein